MSYGSTVLATAGLVSYWRLGESSGTSAGDSKGTNTGTYTNAPTLGASGVIIADADTAVTMATASSQYVTVPDSASLDLGDTFTFECWVRLTSNPSTPYCFGDRGAGSWIVRTADTGNAFIVRKNGTSTLVTSTISLVVGRRYHIVVTKSVGTTHLWANSTDVTGTVTNATMTNNALPLCIGAADGGTNDYLNGTIDEVAVYSVALSAATIQAHYVAGINTDLAGAASFTGGQARRTGRPFAATTNDTGALSRQGSRKLPASLATAGNATRRSSRVLTGTLPPSGSLARFARRSLSAMLTPVGMFGAGTLHRVTLAATLVATGGLSRTASRVLSATVVATGALTRRTRRSFVGNLGNAGTLVREASKQHMATLTTNGVVSKMTRRGLSPSTLTFAGSISRQIQRVLMGGIAVLGAFSHMRRRLRLPGFARPSGRVGHALPAQRTGRSSPTSDEGEG